MWNIGGQYLIYHSQIVISFDSDGELLGVEVQMYHEETETAACQHSKR